VSKCRLALYRPTTRGETTTQPSGDLFSSLLRNFIYLRRDNAVSKFTGYGLDIWQGQGITVFTATSTRILRALAPSYEMGRPFPTVNTAGQLNCSLSFIHTEAVERCSFSGGDVDARKRFPPYLPMFPLLLLGLCQPTQTACR
jgi:hypothetical protein